MPDRPTALQCLSQNRSNLHHFAEAFVRSVELFELMERGGGPPSQGVLGGAYIQYRIIAAKDGALNIFHFSCSLAAVRHQLPSCRDLLPQSRPDLLREASKQFNAYFPNCDAVRHAVAHEGELAKNPAQMAQNTVKEYTEFTGGAVGPGALMMKAIYNRTYTVGINGSVFSVSLHTDSIQKLIRVLSMVDAAFPS